MPSRAYFWGVINGAWPSSTERKLVFVSQKLKGCAPIFFYILIIAEDAKRSNYAGGEEQ